MKKMLCVLLALLLCPMLALAEESVAEPLSYQELVSWAEGYLARAKESTPLNDSANALTPDGYEFVYDFATLYADTPDMSNDTALNAVVLTIDMENGPRSVNVDNAMSVVLDAYYGFEPEKISERRERLKNYSRTEFEKVLSIYFSNPDAGCAVTVLPGK